jgi:hypothetical protein
VHFAGALPHSSTCDYSACNPLINMKTDVAMHAAVQSFIDTRENVSYVKVT